MNRLYKKILITVKISGTVIFVILFSGLSLHDIQDKPIRVRLGYSLFAFQDVSAADASAAIKVYAETFKERIAKRLHRPTVFTSQIFNSTKDIIDALNKNELDLMSVLSTEYFQIKKQHDIYPFLAVTAKDNAFEQYCLVVRNDLKIKQIADLSGKTLAIPDPKYHPVMMEWLFNYLAKNNMPEPSATFSKLKTFTKESNATYDVFFQNSDCTIIRKNVYSTLCELNPQIKNKLTVFVTSVPMVLNFLAANSSSDPEIIKIMLEEMRDFNLVPGGRNILNIFKANKWIRISNNDLKSVEEIINENEAFRKKSLGKKIK